MKIYDSLTRETRELKVKDKAVQLYCCGPTVYNYIHLGNARPNMTMDFLVRFLTYQGIQVNYLQNITDVDDKIINKALATKQDEATLTSFYTEAYLADLKQLNIQLPTKIIKVSEVIPEMLAFIQKLVDQGDAYLSEGNVFFNLEKWSNEYGRLANRSLANIAVSRLESEEAPKKHPADFALWKKTITGIKWPAAFGAGRPGWHTECALLNDLHFNHQTITLHGGGIDLKFPHHENERIQYLAANHQELSDVWMHNGHLTFDNEKMSKSVGNTILVRDFLAKESPDLLRWLFMTTSYTQPLDVNEDLLNQGRKFLERLNNLSKKAKQLTAFDELVDETSAQSTHHFLERFEEFMNDDLNTPLVLSEIEQAIKVINKELANHQLTTSFQELKTILAVLGFQTSLNPLVNETEKKLFQRWKEALNQKNYQLADQLREELMKKDLL